MSITKVVLLLSYLKKKGFAKSSPVVKSKGKISQHFVAFSEYMNFTWPFSQTFGLDYSPLNSDKLSCSSEVTLMQLNMSYTTTLLHFLKITGWIIRSLSLPCVLSPSDEICIHCYQIFLVLHNLQCSFVCQVSTCDILVTGPQKTSWFCLIDFSI